MKKHTIEVYLAFLVVILGAVFLRLIPHIPNVSPIAALAFFSGAVTPVGWALFMPILAMFVSDLFLGFHQTMPYVYISFLLIVGLGLITRKKLSPITVGLGSLAGSLSFYIITNFGVWVTTSMYEKSLGGLLKCYLVALPFFRNTILGDLFYMAVFFLGYRIIRLSIILMMPSHSKRERHAGNTV